MVAVENKLNTTDVFVSRSEASLLPISTDRSVSIEI